MLAWSLSSAVVIGGLGVGFGLHEAGRVASGARDIVEPVRRDLETAESLRASVGRELDDARRRLEQAEASDHSANWGRLLGYLAMVAEDRCVFREVQVRVPEGDAAGSPARLTATVRGEAVSRGALMEMVAGLEQGRVFSEVRLVRFSEDGGAFDLRLSIDRTAGGDS